MPWLSATFVVDTAVVEPLSDALIDAGAISVDVSDADAGTARERPVFDEPEYPASSTWSKARLSALFGADVNVPAAMASACEQAGVKPATAFEVARVEDDDWVRRTQAQFTPQHVTQRLWIVPSWHEAPQPDALNIVLDPGLAFGTGTHPTTRLCLRWLDRVVRGGESIIDFGCGSGILAIAALKLGAARASGVDIDAQAIVAARRNAVQNRAAATFVSAADHLSGPADILVANILAQPLIVLAPLLAELTRQGGRLALSGILVEQAAEVQETYGAWYDFEPMQDEDG
ncbi:MAG TPA: 50S ribosomal protein L11 methyltransferase, partial [Burkholderiales bacterium]|nr:50S ribosomal protein L11 methyltransferase [Burkholderiales bacterium]